MKRSRLILIVGIIAALAGAGTAGAEISKAEKNLERESKRLNDTAAKPDGEQAVLKKIRSEFKVEDALIRSLKERTSGYGEVSIVLSLAQKMPGGVTEADVQHVLSLRQGLPTLSWGQIAHQLGARLEVTVSQIKKMSNDANREIKKDHARAGKADKKTGQERAPDVTAPSAPKTFEGEGRPMTRGGGAM